MMRLKLCLISLVFAASFTLEAQEAKVVLRSTVTGNQEQPKVLYIVPWQQAEIPGITYKPMQGLVEDVYEQVDRAEFLRELSYREQINSTLVKSSPSN